MNRNCAWVIGETGSTQCIEKEQCNDDIFKNDNCVEGARNKRGVIKKKNSRSICKAITIAKPINKDCEKKADCKKCLNYKKNGAKCAWFVQDDVATCIDQKLCNEKEYKAGNCARRSGRKKLKGINKSTCDAIINSAKKEPEADEPNESFANIFKSCGDCVGMGYFWSPLGKKCLHDCKLDPRDDVSCVSAKSAPPVPFELETIGISIVKVRIDSEASMMCAKSDLEALEDSNHELCDNAGTDCKSCVKTLLRTPPGIEYFTAPTCTWFPDQIGSGKCSNEQSDSSGSDTMTCDPPVLPPSDTRWPNLLDKDWEVAEGMLIKTYGKDTLDIQQVVQGDPVTRDYRSDRVRLVVDKDMHQTIVEIPRIG